MKKPTLYYSDATFKALVKRLATADSITGATARRLAETMKYDRWLIKQLDGDVEVLREFIREVFAVLYDDPCATVDLGQALDDLRAIVETANANVTAAVTH